MHDLLEQSELFRGLSGDQVSRLEAIAKPKTLCTGEYLFLLGDNADRIFVVVSGKVDLCFPISLGSVMKDISVEAAIPGKTLGWSALVKPYRFTLSARGAEASELVTFTRRDLLQLFDEDHRIGLRVLTKVSEIVGIRLLKTRALWARELQRALVAEVAQRGQ